MSVQKSCSAILLISLIWGCEKPELIPRTNPRVSVAFIQDIDDSGAQFTANIYDFGSEEILEYGFLYSTNSAPRPENSETLRLNGKPNAQFEIKAEHSMVKGKTYYVVAFLKTESGMVFSQPQSFVSQGAAGFVFEKLEYKEPLFFGDTITVIGSNFSNNRTNYKVRFQREESHVVDAEHGFFKFTVPEISNIHHISGQPNIFDLSFEVLGKKMEMEVHIDFQDAVIEEKETQWIDYGGTIEINGDFFLDRNIRVFTMYYGVNGLEYKSAMTIESSDRKKIVAKPSPISAQQKNYVQVEIRGKAYDLGPEVFKYNPTEIDPGQRYVVSYDEPFFIKGRNFNVAAGYKHRGMVDGQSFELNAKATDSETLEVKIRARSFILGRTNDLKIETLGQISQNSLRIALTDPDIPFIRKPIPSLSLASFLKYGNMTGFEDKGYALGNREIFKIDIPNKTMAPLRALQIGAQSLRFTFSVAHGENWYLGGGHTSNLNPFNRSFFVLNMRSGEVRRLPDLPLNQFRPMLSHIVNNHLYLEGGLEPESGNDHRLRYKFNLSTQQWTRLPDKVAQRNVVGRTVAFHYKGRHLSIGEPIGTGDEGGGLFEFDTSTENWHLLKRFPLLGINGVKTDEVFIVGEKAILMGREMRVLNLETMELRMVTNLSNLTYLTCEFHRNMAFMANGKIYAWDCDETIWEIDPERLEY